MSQKKFLVLYLNQTLYTTVQHRQIQQINKNKLKYPIDAQSTINSENVMLHLILID